MVSLNDLDWVKLAYSNQDTALDLELDISCIIIITLFLLYSQLFCHE